MTPDVKGLLFGAGTAEPSAAGTAQLGRRTADSPFAVLLAAAAPGRPARVAAALAVQPSLAASGPSVGGTSRAATAPVEPAALLAAVVQASAHAGGTALVPPALEKSIGTPAGGLEATARHHASEEEQEAFESSLPPAPAPFPAPSGKGVVIPAVPSAGARDAAATSQERVATARSRAHRHGRPPGEQPPVAGARAARVAGDDVSSDPGLAAAPAESSAELARFQAGAVASAFALPGGTPSTAPSTVEAGRGKTLSAPEQPGSAGVAAASAPLVVARRAEADAGRERLAAEVEKAMSKASQAATSTAAATPTANSTATPTSTPTPTATPTSTSTATPTANSTAAATPAATATPTANSTAAANSTPTPTATPTSPTAATAADTWRATSRASAEPPVRAEPSPAAEPAQPQPAPANRRDDRARPQAAEPASPRATQARGEAAPSPAGARPAAGQATPAAAAPTVPPTAHVIGRELGTSARLAQAGRTAPGPEPLPGKPARAAAPEAPPPGAGLQAPPPSPEPTVKAAVAPPAPARPTPPEPPQPALQGTIQAHAAHLRLESDTLGDLSLHLRVRDGVAHVRLEGEQAAKVAGHGQELQRALAAEGLKLGHLEANRPQAQVAAPSEQGRAGLDQGQPQGQPHDAPERREGPGGQAPASPASTSTERRPAGRATAHHVEA